MTDLISIYDLINNKKLRKNYDEMMRQWTIPIIISLGNREHSGFNQIKNEINGINSNTLSKMLSIFEKHDLVKREILNTKPVKVRYSFTYRGREFYKIISSLSDFLIEWVKTGRIVGINTYFSLNILSFYMLEIIFIVIR